MRIAYLDCFAGISGDMFLGALLDAGVAPEVLQDATAALNLGAKLKIEKVDRSGISSSKVHVFEGGHLAEENHHHHTHPHVHCRSLEAIRSLIHSAPLSETVKQMATHAFELLGHSEAKIHDVPLQKIHFHEVGAVDAIIDVVAVCAGIHHLQLDAWYCSPLNVGGGSTTCAHGTFPVPAPATADLLRNIPTYSAHVQAELVTPTGAALIRMLNPTFGQQPAMLIQHIGYGAGTRNPKGFPNVLRLNVGETADSTSQSVTVLETALDDISPQILAHVTETAFLKGALDVMLTPVIMKKGRPGTLLTVLCDDSRRSALEQLILSETSTLGLRVRNDARVTLDRHYVTVKTQYGDIRMKIGSRGGEDLNLAPEFEDCRTAALHHSLPVKQVQQTAIANYLAQVSRKASS